MHVSNIRSAVGRCKAHIIKQYVCMYVFMYEWGVIAQYNNPTLN